MSLPPLPPIKFADLATALLAQADNLLAQWLPGGSVKGHEYFVHSVWRDEKTASLSVRLQGNNAGRWQDHGGDKKGGDLLSLYAAINNLDQGQAALQLARQLGLEDVAGVRRAGADHVAPPPVVLPKAPARVVQLSDKETWTAEPAVPAHAPAPTFWHFEYRNDKRQAPIDHQAEYRRDDVLFGYVVRFIKTDGKKEPLPHTWCTGSRDGGSAWKWKQFAQPRPLYLPLGTLAPDTTVVLVEGEKKAGVLQDLLQAGAPGIYTVAAWPGGGKAWDKADWSWLAGRTVLLWPDCDGQREPLSTAQREATPDDLARQVLQQAQPILPAAKQPGMKAMLGIGAHLRDAHQASVSMLAIPEPGAVESGWDCADAINTDGWDFERVLAFFGTATPLVADGTEAKKIERPVNTAGGDHGDFGGGGDGGGGAGDFGDGDAFASYLRFAAESAKCEVGQLGVSRKLLIAALRLSPALNECLGFDELVSGPVTQKPFPWRNEPGPINDNDDLRLGDWLSREYRIKAASRAALAEAMATVADARHFHPVRDWLKSLTHDGVPRMDKWLIHVLGMDPETLPPKRRKYVQMVGRFLLLGLVARVMQPGCKFDYSPVLEGVGGLGKSTFVRELVGDSYFSDTHFDIGGGNDGFEKLQGLWGYELSELTALRKADSEQVKQFFSSQSDRYRGAYGRFVQDHPRQVVIFCSTNKTQYLYDLTGNRRFWPIMVTERPRISWLKKWREQLFAEALALFVAGERYAPTPEEEALYFVPEQEKRLVETAVQSRLYELLTREGVPAAEGKTLTYTMHTSFVTLDGLVLALGTDAGKSNSLLESQIRGWLEARGWRYGRESTGQRRRGYMQPAVWPPKFEDEEPDVMPAPTNAPTQAQDNEGDDDAPF